jgi:secernin
MCDTFVALGSVTTDGTTLFGKNSDREPNEAQYVTVIPAAQHPAGANGAVVKCTYIEIPQVPATYAVLLSKPFWIWGAEMGVNECGVAIGNEAVFTKVPYDKKPGLIGMDLLRLALERAATARAAVDVITGLLAQFGQGGNCGFQLESYYHNSFLLADPSSAWVLETAGPHWAAEEVHDIRSISNGLTIGSHIDLASPDLVSYAVDRGWCKGRDDFHFARCYSDFTHTYFSRSAQRQCRTTALLTGPHGRVSPATLMAALRDHGPDATPGWTPARGLTTFSVCAHAGFGPVRHSQSTGSLVAQLRRNAPVCFVTGTSAPCTGVYKPVWLDAALPDIGPTPDGTFNPAALYWQHERLHRGTLRNFPTCHALYRGERDALETNFIAGAKECAGGSRADRAAYSAACFTQAADAEARWTAQVLAHPAPSTEGFLYGRVWRGWNRQAGMSQS